MYKRKTHAYISFVYMYSLMYINRHILYILWNSEQIRLVELNESDYT
jgi:hypothetical protein